MKKLFFAAAMAIVALGSCTRSAGPSANLKTDVDTLSYELGMLNSRGLKQYLADRMGVDTTKYMDAFFKGLTEAALAGDDKKQSAYYAGIQIGQQLGVQIFKGINMQVYGNDSTESISLRNLLSGFIAGTKGKTLFDAAEVEKGIQARMDAVSGKAKEKTYGENKAAGEKFLAENATKEGVKTTESGLQYKVLKEGNGPIPADTSRVLVSYEGRLIDGTVFDSSYKNNEGKPIEVNVNQMIPGWIEALTLMPVGSTWELYIPQELAYGSREAGDKIKPFSALVFKIELAEIK